jgi:hypothetical protein
MTDAGFSYRPATESQIASGKAGGTGTGTVGAGGYTPWDPAQAVASAGGAGPGIGMQPGDISGRAGSYGGAFNVPKGSPQSGQRQTITLSNGTQVTVNAKAAEQFKGFFNDMIAAGAPVKSLGGYGNRPGNPSQHPPGLAIDWAQHSRNVVDPDVQRWISSNRGVLDKLEEKWGMSGGEKWKSPDTGHFSIQTLYGTEHLAKLRGTGAGTSTAARPSTPAPSTPSFADRMKDPSWHGHEVGGARGEASGGASGDIGESHLHEQTKKLRQELSKPIKTKVELETPTHIETTRRSAARQTSRWDRIAQDRNDRHRSPANMGFA